MRPIWPAHGVGGLGAVSVPDLSSIGSSGRHSVTRLSNSVKKPGLRHRLAHLLASRPAKVERGCDETGSRPRHTPFLCTRLVTWLVSELASQHPSRKGVSRTKDTGHREPPQAARQSPALRAGDRSPALVTAHLPPSTVQRAGQVWHGSAMGCKCRWRSR